MKPVESRADRNIKLTLSTDPNLRAPSIEAEKAWLAKERKLFYPLGPRRPKFSDAGNFVYFIRAGKVVARALIAASATLPAELWTYTGRKHVFSGFSIQINEMELATRPVPHRGFQGFRYVQPDEEADFEEAFS